MIVICTTCGHRYGTLDDPDDIMFECEVCGGTMLGIELIEPGMEE